MCPADYELAQSARRKYVLEAALREVLPPYSVAVVDVGHSEIVQLDVMVAADAPAVPTTPAKPDAGHR